MLSKALGLFSAFEVDGVTMGEAEATELPCLEATFCTQKLVKISK